MQYGALAQLGERYTGSVEVSGSIPLCSTKQKACNYVGYKLFFFLLFLGLKPDLCTLCTHLVSGFLFLFVCFATREHGFKGVCGGHICGFDLVHIAFRGR